ncbi:hypothetical protein, partial [Polaromonas sp.]
KTDFYPSAKEYVFRGQGHTHAKEIGVSDTVKTQIGESVLKECIYCGSQLANFTSTRHGLSIVFNLWNGIMK